MKELLKIVLVMMVFFMSIFLLMKVFGLFSIDDIKSWLSEVSEINHYYLILLIASLLLIDLFIAIPTLAVTILAGYFLGFALGALSVFIGLMFSGLIGYVLSRRYGSKLLLKIYKDQTKLDEMQYIFNKHGSTVLIMCRAMPMLPEISCCLSGANRMPFLKFILFYILGTVPYLLIATYAGSQSTLENPKPAILAVIGIFITLWIAWFFFYKKRKIT